MSCAYKRHADDTTAEDVAARLSPTHHRAFHTAGQPTTAVGLLTLVRHSMLIDAEVHTETVQAGRILIVRATFSSATIS